MGLDRQLRRMVPRWHITTVPWVTHGTLLQCHGSSMAHYYSAMGHQWHITAVPWVTHGTLLQFHGSLMAHYYSAMGHTWDTLHSDQGADVALDTALRAG